jgi:hypothetical protein
MSSSAAPWKAGACAQLHPLRDERHDDAVVGAGELPQHNKRRALRLRLGREKLLPYSGRATRPPVPRDQPKLPTSMPYASVGLWRPKPIRKSSFFLPAASAACIHFGIRPRPLHNSPFGPLYFGSTTLPSNLFAVFPPPRFAGCGVSPKRSRMEMPSTAARRSTSSLSARFSSSAFSRIFASAASAICRSSKKFNPSSVRRSCCSDAASSPPDCRCSDAGAAFLSGIEGPFPPGMAHVLYAVQHELPALVNIRSGLLRTERKAHGGTMLFSRHWAGCLAPDIGVHLGHLE